MLAILRLLDVGESAAYYAYVRIREQGRRQKSRFRWISSLPMQPYKNSYKVGYFEAARCWRIRSILCVCEDSRTRQTPKEPL